MSFRLKHTVTAARLAANRRSALKSTGPRTETGKRRSSLNAMRGGGRSKAMDLFWKVLATAPVGEVLEIADRLMACEQRLQCQELLRLFRSSSDVEDEIRWARAGYRKKEGSDRSLRLFVFNTNFRRIQQLTDSKCVDANNPAYY